jgi:ATP-dependent DNA ligase
VTLPIIVGMAAKIRAGFVGPMLLLKMPSSPEGEQWLYELKLDGFRAIAFKTGGRVHLRSRNNKDFRQRYPTVVRALEQMPDETVIDGEIVALDESGMPLFNVLQNYGSSPAPVFYHLFDIMMIGGRDLMCERLFRRRELLQEQVLTN